METGFSAGVAKNGREVKAETINAERVVPISERINDQILGNGIRRVVIATDAGVIVIELVIGS